MTSRQTNYSVLMSVYKKETPEFLELSMQSIYEQTIPTNDFVLICDGELTEGLDKIIAKMQKKFGDRLNVVRFKENQGLGKALQAGIKACKNELIARMDSDDYSKSDRCEKQIATFAKDKKLDIVGSNVVNFKDDIKNATSSRNVPETHEDIIKYAKSRNPFNHPTVMYKKQAVLESGNYQDVRYCQDYYLWVDMLSSGHRGYNIQEPLVLMREDDNTYKRRSGRKYFAILKQLLKRMKDKKFITKTQYYKQITIRFCQTMSPNWIRNFVFKKIMRRSKA